MAKSWKQAVLAEIADFCDQRGSRTFTLQEFMSARLTALQGLFPGNKHPTAKIRQQMQFLRDEELLGFVDNRGTYTFRIPLLRHEREAVEATGIPDLSAPRTSRRALPVVHPSDLLGEKQEHFVETYVRNRGWAQAAKEQFGMDCLIRDCSNRFKKPDGTAYIEVHHIIPLCEGGEDGIWNLSVLCAHHHRMAHFADHESKANIKHYLGRIVAEKLKG